jgi:GT2 family glycosyltransferase
MQTKKAYIVILNYNGWQDTLECLESVYHSDYPNYQVIVCDNASSDGSLDQIKQWARGERCGPMKDGMKIGTYTRQYIEKPITYVEFSFNDNFREIEKISDRSLILLKSDYNRGFSGGNNLGLQYALQRNDFFYIWILNNDTVVDSHALSALIARQMVMPNCGAVGSVLCYYKQPYIVQCIGGILNKKTFTTDSVAEKSLVTILPDNVFIELLAGASYLITQEFLQNVGLMDESYFLYYEEIELATRAKKMGWNITYARNSLVYHKGGATTGKTSTAYKDYHLIRSQLIFVRKYYPTCLSSLLQGYKKMFYRRIKHLHVKRAWAIYKGVHDGLNP